MKIFRLLVRYFKSLLTLKTFVIIIFVFAFLTYALVIKDRTLVACQRDDHVERQNMEVSSLTVEQLEKLKQEWLAEQQRIAPKVVGDEPPNSDSKAHSVSPVECLINDDYPIQCLRSNEPDEDVFMPFSFLAQYFDVTGKMKHYDGYDRFEFSQSYSKVFYQPTIPYNYHGKFMTFESYNVEVRERVKCISGKEGVPVSTQWGKRAYYYSIQISQFGLSHYCKNLVEKPPQFTVYEDGESGIQSKWKTSNRHCTVTTKKDDDLATKVVKFSTPDGHKCNICKRNLIVAEAEVLDNLFSLEEKLTDDTLNTLIFLGEYIERKAGESTEDTKYYYKMHGKYVDYLNRGGLAIPESIPLGNGVTLSLGNTMEYELSFDIKFVSNGSISVVLDTSSKSKQHIVHYVTTDILVDFDRHSDIFYGLGPSKSWRHISRNLLIDLRKGLALIDTRNQPKKSKVNIHKVSRLIVRGEGFIDNITIAKTAHITHFHDASEWIVKHQDQATGGWKNDVERPYKFGFSTLSPGWLSAMAQGQAMSLLARAYHTFHDKLYIKSMSLALRPFTVPSEKGGVKAIFMNRYVWYEEYPTTPSSFVLNGFIYSLIGLYDFKSLLEDRFKLNYSTPAESVLESFSQIGVDLTETYKQVSQIFDDGMASLKVMLPLYDGGSRTFYDLRHFMLKIQPNIARWDYHTTHLSQLALLYTISDDPIFKRYFDYWVGYMKGKRASHN